MSEHEQEQAEPVAPSPDETVEPEQDEEPVTAPDESAAPGDEPDAPAEPGQEPEPQMLSQKQLERAMDKLDREAKRHHARVTEIMGDDAAMLMDCPLCDALTPGKVMPSPETPTRFPAVREFIGDAPPRELRPDPDAARCETCDGQGVVATGSRVPDQAELPCMRCGGYGWNGPRRAQAGAPSPPPAVLAEGNGPVTTDKLAPAPPEVEELRRRGYTIIEPVR